MKYGHIKISRRAYATDPYWLEPREFSKWEAWEWFIQAAAWEPVTRDVTGIIVELKRGEVLASIRYLSDKWCWGHKQTRLFLANLLKTGRLRAQRETQAGTVYLLVKYDTYQNPEEKRAQQRNGKGHTEGTPRAHRGAQVKGSFNAVKAVKSVSRAGARETDQPTDFVENSVENSIDKLIEAANRGTLENSALTRPKLMSVRNRSRSVVAGWIAQGISIEVAARIIYERARDYRPTAPDVRISSMGYFDAAITEAIFGSRAALADIIPVDRKRQRTDVEEWKDANPDGYSAIEADVERSIDSSESYSRASYGVRKTVREGWIRDEVRRRIAASVTEATA